MEKDLKALIVDDERKAQDLLKDLLFETLCFGEIRMADSIEAACNELSLFLPDIIFLDVKMPEKDGFCYIDEMPSGIENTEIVLVTAYDKFAIKAIKKNVFDYLLKPVNREELNQCILKLIDKKKNNANNEIKINHSDLCYKPEKLRIATRPGSVFINPDHILYWQANGNYISICTVDKLYTCSVNLGKVEDLLSENGFIRIGRSFIINYNTINLLDRKKNEISLCRDTETVVIKVPKQYIN